MNPDPEVVVRKVQALVDDLHVAMAEMLLSQTKFGLLRNAIVMDLETGNRSPDELRKGLAAMGEMRTSSDVFIRVGSLMRRICDLSEPLIESLIEEGRKP